MDEIPGWVIVVVVLVFVLLFNIGLASSALRQQPRKGGLFRGKTLSEMMNPWHEEDQSLAKLRREVEELEKGSEQQPDEG